jgi:hypothetical protein
MTFLKTRFRLSRALRESDLKKFGTLSAVYGIRGLAVDGNDLVVDYDASRVHEAEVLSEVLKLGLPVAPREPIRASSRTMPGPPAA